mgnify:CR=1 FL=1
MDKISYKLPDFEGPLDLLLFLVQKRQQLFLLPIKHNAHFFLHQSKSGNKMVLNLQTIKAQVLQMLQIMQILLVSTKVVK